MAGPRRPPKGTPTLNTVADLQQELQTRLFDNQDGKDLEKLFQAHLNEYAAYSASIQSEWSGRKGPDLQALFAPPPDEMAKGEEDIKEEFRNWRLAHLGNLVNLDAQLPVLAVCAERMRKEVGAALSLTCGEDTLFKFVPQQLLRRFDRVHSLRRMALLRLSQCGPPSGSTIPAGSLSDGHGARHAAVASFVKLMDKEAAAIACRLQHLRSNSSLAAVASTSLWSSSAIVLTRQFVLEDLVTQRLHHFLSQIQYLGLRHRARLWKRALEYHAIICMPSHSDSNSTVPASRASLPLGVASRKHLEKTLQELGPSFGCGASLTSDKGKTFAHQVALAFPHVFEQQQQRWAFKLEAAGGTRARETRDEQPNTEGAVPGVDESSDAATCYLRQSGWELGAPWKAEVDPVVLEQGLLLSSSAAARSAPHRAQRGKASYAHQLLDGVLSNLDQASLAHEGKSNSWLGWESDVDSVLKAEWAFLAASDAKTVVRRLSELAEGRPHSEDPAAGVSTARGGNGVDARAALPPPLLRAHLMLRHLQCRAQRWQLLGLLNFYRFLLRHLVVGLSTREDLKETAEATEPNAERYWELSPQTLSRRSRCCHMPSTARHRAEPLQRESLLKVGEEVRVLDMPNGRRVMHAAALEDLATLEREMLSIGSYFIHKFESVDSSALEELTVDRVGVLHDLYSSEVWFNTEKRNLLEVYLEIYEHTADLLERRDLEQRMVDVMAIRPRLNLEEDAYFTAAYAASICNLSARTSLLRSLLRHQLRAERTPTSAPSVPTPLPATLVAGSGRRGRSRRATSEAHNEGAGGVDAALTALAHPREGHRCCGALTDATSISPTPSAGAVAVDEFCGSACLVWKAELVIEEVHRDLVKHFLPQSPLMVTLMERACFALACEQWRAGGEDEEAGVKRQRPHEDPELLLLIVKETANRLMSGPSHAQLENPHDDEDGGQSCPPALKEIGGLDISGWMQYGFAELRRKGGYNLSGTVGYMLATLLEHVHLRRHIGVAAVEVACLEKALKAQAAHFGVKFEALRMPPVHCAGADAGADFAVPENAWIDASGPVLSAGMIDSEMGVINLASGPSLAEGCSPLRVQELRRIYQHELAYRNLVLTCVQHNVLLLDPQIRQKELTDVVLVGPSRDMIAGDLGALIMQKLRETVELSGPSRENKSANKATQRKAKASEPGYIDTSRYTQNHLQTPQTHLGPVLVAIGKLHSEKSAALRNSTRPAESDRFTRLLRYNLLVCSSTFLTASARDLSIRVQAANASLVLRSVAALIPAEITPFDCTQGRKQPLIERDGLVGNVFSASNALDLLQLRTSLNVQDLSAAMEETLTQVAHRSNEFLQFSEAGEHEVPASLELPFKYDGPASNALRIIHWLTVLLTLRYALSTLSGDPVTVLRMRRHSRYASLEDSDAVQDGTHDGLSSMDHTFEAFEELCSELARLAWRLDSLGAEAARDPHQVIPVLQAEVAIAQQQVLLLLRRASRFLGQSFSTATAGTTWDTALPLAWAGLFQPESEASKQHLSHKPHVAPAPLTGPARAESADCEGVLRVDPTAPWKANTTRLQLTSLREDMRRYARELHPEQRPPHPLQRPFMCALVKPMEDSVPGSLVRQGRDDFFPQETRLPWCHPEVPCLALISCVCTLPAGQCHKIADIHSELQEKRKAFHAFGRVKAQSKEAADADAEFFGCLLLLEVLADNIAFGRLASTSLGNCAGTSALREQLDSVLIPEECIGLPGTGGVSRTPKREVSAEGVVAELMAIRQRLWDLVTRLDRTLVAFAGLQLRNELTAAAEVRHRAEAAPFGAIARPVAAGDIHADRVDSLFHMLNGLRACSTFVQMDPNGTGERAYVLTESDLNTCLGGLVAALPDWGASATQSRGWLVEALLFGQRVWLAAHMQALRWDRPEVEAGVELQRREVRGRSAVASRGCRLVLEVDRLRRVVRELKLASGEIEQRLGSEIWDKARAALSLLASTLASRTGHFQERHGGSSNELEGRLRGLREHVTSCLATLASKNFAVQECAARGRRSEVSLGNSAEIEARDGPHEGQPLSVSKGMHLKLRGVARRADLQQLELKVQRLKSRQVYARTFHCLKCQTLRQRCSEQMKVLRMTLESNSELSERLAQALQNERVASDSFSANARTISLSEQRIEELRAQVESNTEQHSRLQNWKKSKVKQLAYGNRAVSERQREGGSDTAGLLGELREKAELLRQLQQEHLAKEAMLETAASQGRQHSAQARQELQRRRHTKEATRQELQKLRAEVERGGLSDDERLRIWRDRVAGASRRLAELQEENQQLRNLVPSAAAAAVES